MYLFYVEESGQRDYNPNNSRYFVLLCVGIGEDEWHSLNQRINRIKTRHFGTRNVKIKSTFLRSPQKRLKNYLEPFREIGLTEETLKEFTDDMYALIDAAPITLFAVVIDKHQMQEQYNSPDPTTPLAYRMLMERIQTFLETQENAQRGLIIHDLIHDLIDENPNNPKSHQKEIVDLHEKMIHDGRTDYKDIPNLIEGVHFLPDDQSTLLQIADLMAYNVYRQFTDNGSQWDEGITLDRMTKYGHFERILPKFFRRAGRLKGYGIKKFPQK